MDARLAQLPRQHACTQRSPPCTAPTSMPLCVLLARCLLLACRGCSLRDSDYAQVFQDLAPFREGGGVDEAMLRRLSAALPGTLLASVGAALRCGLRARMTRSGSRPTRRSGGTYSGS